MKIIGTFIISVFAAYFLNLISLAIMGSIIGLRGTQELLGGNNSFPLFVIWWAITITTLIGMWAYKKYVARKLNEL